VGRLIADTSMKLRELESWLSEVEPFAEPKYELEQYPTSAHLAARMLFVAETSFGDIEGRRVCDLGCGTAILGIGAHMLGAR
jgi:predicted RNA methylase